MTRGGKGPLSSLKIRRKSSSTSLSIPVCSNETRETQERSISVRLQSTIEKLGHDREQQQKPFGQAQHELATSKDDVRTSIRAQLEVSNDCEETLVQSAPVSVQNSVSSSQPAPARKLLSDGAITPGYFHWNRRRRRRRRKRDYVSNYRPRKIVVVGDMHGGKSCLVSSYCLDKFNDVYSPTIMRCIAADTKIQKKLIDIIVVDTPGRYDYLPLRQVAYKKSDLVMICFALDAPESLENVENFWVPEVQKNAPGIPYILVGNRRDCRDELYANWCCCEICKDCHIGCEKGFNTLKRMEADQFLHSSMLSYDQGSMVAKKVGAVGYQECSAKFRDNTRTVFEHSTEMAMKKHRRKRRHKMRGPEACVIL